MNKGGLLSIAFLLLLCLSVFFNIFLLVTLTDKKGLFALERRYRETVLLPGAENSKIVLIPLVGTIGFSQSNALGDSMVDDLKEAFQQAASDPDVKAIVISADSPGGEVTASDVLYHSLRSLAQQKPVVYYINSIGASGAYYTACGASWIMCSPTTFTGSIGVIISTLNYQEFFGKIGLRSLVFRSGKFKDMLNPAREMAPEERVYVQELVMQTYRRFVQVVSSARNLAPDILYKGVADGRILSGEDAYREKLVDSLGYIEDAYAKAKELGSASDASIVSYTVQFSFSTFLSRLSQGVTQKVQLNLLHVFALEPGRLYLLPSILVP
jgi:protease IV